MTRHSGPPTLDATGIADNLELPTRGAQLLVIGDGFVLTQPLPDDGPVTIGRSDDSDVQIDDPSISRHHAKLAMGSSITIEDVGSVNGTILRGQELVPGIPQPLAVGEVVDLGTVTLVIQRRSVVARARRIWLHDYFEGRLAEECARAERSGQQLGIVRVVIDAGSNVTDAQEALAATLRPTDAIGLYAPNQYEVLILDGGPDELATVKQRISAALAARGIAANIAIAIYPTHGRSPDALLARATPTTRPVVAEGSGPGKAADLDASSMQDLHRLVARIAPSNLSVLILGETGVGKEVLAEEIHRRSGRRAKPFLRLNCAALTETLLESELFGHERGAFTGAVQTKQGLLETAEGGTVFLDEIGELPLTMQVKLLRVLEERKVLRVGGLSAREIDVRFVAATNRDLESAVVGGRFREDLYFRLNGITLVIPPLRERVAEIEPLIEHFLRDLCKREGLPIPTLAPDALALLEGYSWPGNIRELRNVTERAVLLADGGSIELAHLPVAKMKATFMVAASAAALQSLQTPVAVVGVVGAVDAAVDAVDAANEVERIRTALARCNGNQTKAAKLLGVSRRTLVKWLAKHDLPRPRKNQRT